MSGAERTPPPPTAKYPLPVLLAGTLGGLIAGAVGGALVMRQMMPPGVVASTPSSAAEVTRPTAANTGWDVQGLADYLNGMRVPVRVVEHDGATYLCRRDKFPDVSGADLTARFEAGDVGVTRVSTHRSFVESSAAVKGAGKRGWYWQQFGFLSADAEAGIVKEIRAVLSPK